MPLDAVQDYIDMAGSMPPLETPRSHFMSNDAMFLLTSSNSRSDRLDKGQWAIEDKSTNALIRVESEFCVHTGAWMYHRIQEHNATRVARTGDVSDCCWSKNAKSRNKTRWCRGSGWYSDGDGDND